jgi:hypothetical protein
LRKFKLFNNFGGFKKMAGRIGIVKFSALSTGTSAKTLLQLLAATNHAIKILEVSVSFHGTSNTAEPITVEVLRQTTAGTMTDAAPVKADSGVADTLDTTAKINATVEPNAGDILRVWAVHPQTSLTYPVQDNAPLVVPSEGRVGLRVTAPSGVNADGYMMFEE